MLQPFAQMLRKWLKSPLLHKPLIESRLQAVEELNSQVIFKDDLVKFFDQVYDFDIAFIRPFEPENRMPQELIKLDSRQNN